MNEIFLSYARADRERARVFAELLGNQGLSIFWDPEILGGQKFRKIIKEKLNDSKCVIVLWSKDSVESDWVIDEATEGLSRDILVPLLIDDVEPPLGFRQIQYRNFVNWRGKLPNPEFDLLLKSVREILGRPLTIDELNTSVQLLYTEGKYTEAIDKWKEILKLNPDNKAAKDGIEKAQREVNNEKITKLNTDAQRLFREDKYAEAIAKWQEVLKFDSKNRNAIEGIEESEGILKEREKNKREVNDAKNVEREVEKEERISKKKIFKIFIIVGTVSILLLGFWVLKSIIVVQPRIVTGDNISIDYIGSFTDGKVFDTSIESVAKENNIFTSGREYKPLKFTVGKGEVIKGLDNGVIGMEVGWSRTLTIPPDKGYGLIDPKLIQVSPIIQVILTSVPRVIEIPFDQFERTFGQGHKIGDIVKLQNTEIYMTVQNIAKNVSLSYNFKVGDQIPSLEAPWKETIVKIDNRNFIVEYSVKKNDIIQFQNVPWNTTVIDVNSESITLRHNAIPDTNIQSMFGVIRVHFNETSIIMDSNNELAGKTLIFKVILNSIEK